MKIEISIRGGAWINMFSNNSLSADHFGRFEKFIKDIHCGLRFTLTDKNNEKRD